MLTTSCVTGKFEALGPPLTEQAQPRSLGGDGELEGDSHPPPGDSDAVLHGDSTSTTATGDTTSTTPPDGEICDGFDNDGDGEIDEDLPRTPCTDEQGNSGTTTCIRGNTGCEACTPGESRAVECCGPNRTQVCSSAGHWPPVTCDGCGDHDRTACDGPDGCTPGNEQVRRCDTCVDIDACGSDCVGALWVCTDECRWEQATVCQSYPPQCGEDSTFTEGCGHCGARDVRCDGCFWDYSECEQQGVCDPGDSKTAPCSPGNSCAQGRYTVLQCNALCQWEGSQSCDGCVPGSIVTTDECAPGYDCGVRVVRTHCEAEEISICGGTDTIPVGHSTTEVLRNDCPSNDCLPGQTNPGAGCTTPLGECGYRTLSCSSTCDWTTTDSGSGVCTARPSACIPGTPNDTILSCNNSCDPTASYTRRQVCNSAGCGWSNAGNIGSCPVCDTGDTDTESCTLPDGRCGYRGYSCSASCSWQANPTGCVASPNACVPGEVISRTPISCGSGMCGVTRERVVTCRSNGCGTTTSYSGSCPGCAAGSTSSRSCTLSDGRCGARTDTCRSDCSGWSTGSCQPRADSCIPGSSQNSSCTGTCGLTGQRTRSCSSSGCGWNSWGNCTVTETPTCTAGQSQSQTCATCPSASSTRTCTSQCEWGPWSGCPPACL